MTNDDIGGSAPLHGDLVIRVFPAWLRQIDADECICALQRVPWDMVIVQYVANAYAFYGAIYYFINNIGLSFHNWSESSVKS